MKTTAILLAAGKGTRMHSNTPKVLHTLCGYEMIRYVMRAVKNSADQTVLVIGHGAEQVEQTIGDQVQYVLQANPQGTGHALIQAKSYLSNDDELVLIAAGDMPLLSAQTIQRLKQEALSSKASAVVLTTVLEDAVGYGRIVRDSGNQIQKIVEERDATEQQKQIHEINTSIYCFTTQALRFALSQLNNDNAQKEYYLTDCIEILALRGDTISSVQAASEECMGINDLVQLAEANRLMQKRINQNWMQKGVRIMDPLSVWISPEVILEEDAIIYPNNVIEGNSFIGGETILYSGNFIESAVVGSKSKVGPNAHLRKDAKLGIGCRVGNFVELKNVTLGDGAKVSHLAYCGDGDIGARANISCGVIFSNYDGANKSRTLVGEDAFVGCNANLVAPVEVGDGAYIAAGSTITENVPEGALAIARERQTNKPAWNWLKRIKEKKNK